MAKTTMIQTAFLGGEVSPKMLGRTDLKGYDTSTKTMLNALPFYHGGTKRRPGTFFHGEVRDSSFAVKLVPFIYSRTQSFLCVFNNSRIQFIKDGDFIETSPGVRYEITHPYTSDELNELRFAQFGNSVYFTHPNYPPKRLFRTGDTSWTFTDMAFVHRALTDYWYENANIRFRIISNTTNPYTAGGVFTVTSPGGGGAATATFAGTGYGQMVAASKAGSPAETWTVTCIYADSQRQEWSVVGSVSGAMALLFKAGNYPAAIAFYQQRMFLAGTPAQPQTLWGSKSGSDLDITNFTRGPDDNDGVELTLASSSNDMILHMVPSPTDLLIMSYANEFVMSSTSGVYTPKTAIVKPQTTYGCNLVSPLRIGNAAVFVQRDGRRVRAAAYDLGKGSNTAADMTVTSEHITGTGVIDMAFQQDPDFNVWLIRKDGYLVSLTYLNEQDVIAWARHDTDGWFKAVATIPENNSDTTYVCVERLVNGVYKKYIESIDYVLKSLSDATIFGANAVAKTTWTGLGHLEGKEVVIVGDNSNATRKIVTGGQIVLDVAAKEVAIGLPYTTTIELLHPNPQVDGGTARGRQLSVHEVTLVVDQTVSCKVNGSPVAFNSIGQLADKAPVPYSGDKRLASMGWGTPLNMKIEQELPMPFTLLAVVMKVSVND
ncbi:hypothetical protein CY658_21660 [Variovorax sp. RO1]|nr:hypothetical protein CY658_21660 [Variovorax sp. RO1]